MPYLTTLTPGMIYSMKSEHKEFFIIRSTKENRGHYICIERKQYQKDGNFPGDYNWKEASYEHQQWLLECLKQDKYIPLDQINLEHSYLIHF